MTSNSRTVCPKCQKEMRLKSLPYHQCYVAPSAEEETFAWIGDSQHRQDVIRFLISLSYTPAVSHTFLASLVSSKHQAAYMREFRYLTPQQLCSNEHHQAQRFEARYATEPEFVKLYKERLLSHVGGIIHTTMEPGPFSRMSLDHPLPNKVCFVPSVNVDTELYAALLMSLDD